MSNNNFIALDSVRMFWGDLPYSFGFELVFRTTFMYLFLLFILRMGGKRSLAQMFGFEF